MLLKGILRPKLRVSNPIEGTVRVRTKIDAAAIPPMAATATTAPITIVVVEIPPVEAATVPAETAPLVELPVSAAL